MRTCYSNALLLSHLNIVGGYKVHGST